MTKQYLIVIGNGMVGYKFMEKFTALGGPSAYHLITFCEEPRPAYDRVHLSEYFSGKTAEDLSLAPQDWYREQGIELHVGDAVVEIDREARLVRSKKGSVIPYDKIVLATGSTPFVPPVPGIDKEGVFVYRTIEDLDAIIDYSRQCQTAAVIGGGLLGLEAAKALVDLKLNTHVVEFAPRLMPRQIDQTGSDFLRSKIEELAVKIHLNKNTRQIVGNGSVEGMAFADETDLAVDMIVVSAGIRPRDELARTCGLMVGERGGILVNDEMQTSDPDIYAIGECALHGNMIYGLVAPGYRMAETAAKHLLTEEAAFTGSDMSTKLKLMGVDVASIGNAFANGGDSAEVTFADSRAGIYKKLVMSKADNTLKGAILVGDAEEYGQLLQMYLNDMPLPEAPESLIVKGGDAPAGLGVDALPETAQICSCENVSKGAILSCINDGCHTVPAIKQQSLHRLWQLYAAGHRPAQRRTGENGRGRR